MSTLIDHDGGLHPSPQALRWMQWPWPYRKNGQEFYLVLYRKGAPAAWVWSNGDWNLPDLRGTGGATGLLVYLRDRGLIPPLPPPGWVDLAALATALRDRGLAWPPEWGEEPAAPRLACGRCGRGGERVMALRQPDHAPVPLCGSCLRELVAAYDAGDPAVELTGVV